MKSVCRTKPGARNTNIVRCFAGRDSTAFVLWGITPFRLLNAPSSTHKGEQVENATTESSTNTASQSTRWRAKNATTRRVLDTFSLLFLAASILILSSSTSAFAQVGAPISGQWITPGGTPAAHAQIYACPYTGSGIPCYPQSTIYADIGLTIPLPQPYSADQYGNATFYIVPGSYLIQVRVNGSITYSYAYSTNSGGLFNPVLVSQGGTGDISFTPNELIASGSTPTSPLVNITALPNGTTATTQAPGDSSIKVATDAFATAVGANGCLGGNTIANGCTGATTAAGALANLGGAPLAGAAFTGSVSAPSVVAGITNAVVNPAACVSAGAPSWCGSSGQTADYYINRACDQLPSTGGTIDLRGFGATTQVIANPITGYAIPCMTHTRAVLFYVDNQTYFNITVTTGGLVFPLNDSSGVVGFGLGQCESNNNTGNKGFSLTTSANISGIFGNAATDGSQQDITIKGLCMNGAATISASATVSHGLIYISGLGGTNTSIADNFITQCNTACVWIENSFGSMSIHGNEMSVTQGNYYIQGSALVLYSYGGGGPRVSELYIFNNNFEHANGGTAYPEINIYDDGSGADFRQINIHDDYIERNILGTPSVYGIFIEDCLNCKLENLHTGGGSGGTDFIHIQNNTYSFTSNVILENIDDTIGTYTNTLNDLAMQTVFPYTVYPTITYYVSVPAYWEMNVPPNTVLVTLGPDALSGGGLFSGTGTTYTGWSTYLNGLTSGQVTFSLNTSDPPTGSTQSTPASQDIVIGANSAPIQSTVGVQNNSSLTVSQTAGKQYEVSFQAKQVSASSPLNYAFFVGNWTTNCKEGGFYYVPTSSWTTYTFTCTAMATENVQLLPTALIKTVGTTGEFRVGNIQMFPYLGGISGAIPVWQSNGQTLGNATAAQLVAAIGNTAVALANNMTAASAYCWWYPSAANTTACLAGNITTTPQVLTQTGNGSASAAPVLTNAQITINGSAVNLGGSTTITAAAASIAPGTTTVTGGSGYGLLGFNGAALTTTAMTAAGDIVNGGASGAPNKTAGCTGANSTEYALTETTTAGGASQGIACDNIPALTGTNFTGIPNGALLHSSVTVNNQSVALGSSITVNPPLDKSTYGLSNPTADATFTYPATSTSGYTLAGTAPASTSGATGTTATTLFNVNGVAGGASSASGGTGGVGSSPSISGGTGGAGTGTNGNGGAGGSITLTPGSGGAKTGSGTVGAAGVVVIAGNATLSGTLNKLTLTAPATGATLTLADGITLSSTYTMNVAKQAGVPGGIPWYDSTASMSASGVQAQYGVMVGGGAGGAPSTISPDSTTTHALFATAGNPAFRAIASGDLPTAQTTRTVVVTDITPVIGDDLLITVLDPATAIQLTRFSCGVGGSTSVITNLVSGGNSLISDMTATAGTVNQVVVTTWVSGSCSSQTTYCPIAAHTPVTLHIGTISGTPTSLNCAVDYTVN